MYNEYVRLRNERKLSDSQVASATGVARSTFSDWRSGRSEPKLPKLIKIAKFFGVPITSLINQDEQN